MRKMDLLEQPHEDSKCWQARVKSCFGIATFYLLYPPPRSFHQIGELLHLPLQTLIFCYQRVGLTLSSYDI